MQDRGNHNGGGAPYEEWLARALVRTGGLDAEDRARLREAAARAADDGTPLRELIDTYLGALCRTCSRSATRAAQDGPVSAPVPADVLRPIRDVAVTLTEGYEAAHRAAIRREEEIRQAFLDELLHGAGDLGRMAEQAHRIGFRFAGPHRVAVARAGAPFGAADPATRYVEEAMASGHEAWESLVAAKDGLLVCICAGSGTTAAVHFAEQVQRSVARHPQIAVSRPRPGANGVVRSYREAREARETLDLAHRLAVSRAVIHASDLLVFQVLGRDRAAITDLVATVLGGPERARGGPGPLLHTLTTYFDSGCGACARGAQQVQQLVDMGKTTHDAPARNLLCEICFHAEHTPSETNEP